MQFNQSHTESLHQLFSMLLLNRDDCRKNMDLWKELQTLLQISCCASREFLGNIVYFRAFVAMVAQMYPSHFAWFQRVHHPKAQFPEAEIRFLQDRRGYRQPNPLLRVICVLFHNTLKRAYEMDSSCSSSLSSEDFLQEETIVEDQNEDRL